MRAARYPIATSKSGGTAHGESPTGEGICRGAYLTQDTLVHRYRRRCLDYLRREVEANPAMSVERSELLELRESYRGARTAIEKLDGLERDVGLASLRLEAVATYGHLVTTAQGLRDEDAAVLKEYVVNLVGGEDIEASVAWLDSQAKKLANSAISTITTVLSGGVLAGGAAAVAGVVVLIVSAGVDAGAGLATALLGGGSVAYFIVRTIGAAAEGGQQAWVKSWGWASSIGVASDAALADARQRSREIWATAIGAPWRGKLFTAAARQRAQVLVGAAWTLVAIGVLLIGIGALEAISALNDTQVTTLPQP